MKYIEVDEQLYRYIASRTITIGESASDILRRELNLPLKKEIEQEMPATISQPGLEVADSAVAETAADSVEAVTSVADSAAPADSAALADSVASVESERSDETATGELQSSGAAPRSVADYNHLTSDSNVEQMKGAVGRFLYLLEQVHNSDSELFSKVLDVQGKGRLYFATSKEALLASSKTANPKQIGSSGYWVTTNNNTARKQAILRDVLQHLNCEETLAKSIAQRI
ncbi:replication initiation negative regulator SeqA [Paraferrimonas haliotis]|uniref:replication initiation negative regulator SeqA n=1 Tax=Paraferrimonas haliotis TaxID=2013866 RepID=UPI000BA9117A|nr:replication initiation negative regulator SeqA [Paraferrimonas haliotis]